MGPIGCSLRISLISEMGLFTPHNCSFMYIRLFKIITVDYLFHDFVGQNVVDLKKLELNIYLCGTCRVSSLLGLIKGLVPFFTSQVQSSSTKPPLLVSLNKNQDIIIFLCISSAAVNCKKKFKVLKIFCNWKTY